MQCHHHEKQYTYQSTNGVRLSSHRLLEVYINRIRKGNIIKKTYIFINDLFKGIPHTLTCFKVKQWYCFKKKCI